ncbi:MAG TPA: hypothetical protein VJZ00_19855 [Thermoanaerobaculia bacterium]|nr:hypothetical protein [Thermoanaerobaculia bacterium]
MKTILVALLLLTFGCASKDGFIDQRTLECGPGQIVTIDAGLAAFTGTPMEGVDDQHTLLVVVGNNSHEDIVVKAVRADQAPDATSVYRFNSGYRNFNQTIAEGEEAEFKVPMSGRGVRPEVAANARANSDVALDVMVVLGNGDAYRCRFQIPVR